MNWQEIRRQYPKRWLLLEAIGAYSEGEKRVIPELKIIEVFGDDWHEAWEAYKTLHSANRQRELYFLHTDREELNIGVLDIFGRTPNI
ncbi:MAG: hypothetical protein DPW16_01225 [Chloroflexi bacterium]|nr:hypothetical protein [Chloroflexota bacterium]